MSTSTDAGAPDGARALAHPHPSDAAAVADAVTRALETIASARDLDELKAARLAHAGDRSPIALANRAIADLPKPTAPPPAASSGAARAAMTTAIAEREAGTRRRARRPRPASRRPSTSPCPTTATPAGARHPISTMMAAIEDAFVAMGWEVAEGPELETEWFNFDALNFPQDHPAREMQDSFYVLSRATASPGPSRREWCCARTRLPCRSARCSTRTPPIYVVCPGRVYRSDELDATHTPVFHQVEGLAIDRHLTMAHLKGTLDAFARAMFGAESRTRLRPSYFPFTEPSAEMDVYFPGQEGRRRLGGVGRLRHGRPERAASPAVWTRPSGRGYAFGMGIERTLQFRNEIPDMRDLVEGDVRFTTAFGSEV